MKSFNSVVVSCFLAWAASPATAQNVVEDRGEGRVLEPITITEAQASEMVWRVPRPGGAAKGREFERIAAKLDAHVSEFIAGWPWMPFQHTLGISGHEVYFDHSDEMFYSLSLAVPFLPKETATRTKDFLAKRLAGSPPFAIEGFDRRSGHPRESYDVPENLRLMGRGGATSAFGIYAFWAYCHFTGDAKAAKSHWSAVETHADPLLAADCKFDFTRLDYQNDEAGKLNGDLAGCVGFVRLARMNGDAESERRGLVRTRQLLELRVNLERANPRILERTRSSTKHLHISKLARYCSLVPEVAEAVRKLSDGCAGERLRNFREARNGWFMAFGDRLIGGENYTNPAHFPRALFGGAALVEQLRADQLAGFVDVPWCKGDLYFIEKCSLALWAATGKAWEGL